MRPSRSAPWARRRPVPAGKPDSSTFSGRFMVRMGVREPHRLPHPRLRPGQLQELQRARDPRRAARLLEARLGRGKDVLGHGRRHVVGPARHQPGPGHPGRARPRPVGHGRQPRGVALPAGGAPRLPRLSGLPLLLQAGRRPDPRRPDAAGDGHEHPRGRGVPGRREDHRPDVEGRSRPRRAQVLARVLLRGHPGRRPCRAGGRPGGLLAARGGPRRTPRRGARPRGLDLREHLRVLREDRGVQRSES